MIKPMRNTCIILLSFLIAAMVPVQSSLSQVKSKKVLSLDQVHQDTFRYFWETTDDRTGLTPDRYPSDSPASIAAIGFALTVYPIGVEHKYITRAQAAKRTHKTLSFLWGLPQGDTKWGQSGYQGFYYHFLNMNNGLRASKWKIELSTIDTALLLAGVLFSQSYYDQPNGIEKEIRDLADKIYRRVNWTWAQKNPPLISLGWFPGEGFIEYDWVGYNEAMLLYILALGSPTYPIETSAWQAWTSTYEGNWGNFYGFEHLTFNSMFGHQYSHVWIDFRDIQDEYMKQKGSDYFLNSRQAAYAQRAYAIANPGRWDGYGENQWGFTASDGPGKFIVRADGKERRFLAYKARGPAINFSFDDGTLAPTALGGSIPFAPEIILPALQKSYELYGEHLYTQYGFLASYNPSFKWEGLSKTGKVVPGLGWFGKDHIGIDQGPILAMIENHRSGFVWEVMKKNPYIRRGLERAGFSGGWLNEDR